MSASSSLRSASEEISRRRFVRRLATAAFTRARSRCVGSKRRKTSARSSPASLEAAPGAVEQELEVVARVLVEDGEDLVRVDVGQRVLDRDRVVLLRDRRAVLPARVELEEHVLQARLRRSRAVASSWTSLELLVDVELDDRPAVAQVHGGDVADADAGDADGLALAGGDRLRRGDLGLQDERALLEVGDPQPLLLEDVVRTRRRR